MKTPTPVTIGKKTYEKSLHQAQIELLKLQNHVIANDIKVLIIFEGRDAAGKDGSIKRIVEHMSPRETRVVALGKPSDRDERAWYFQRYVQQLPIDGEIVLFNRSWYTRAGVEKVMGFCTDVEYEEFMQSVSQFEQLLVHAGIVILKYYLDITKDEQKRRLKDRREDPLKQWKISPIDGAAQRHWKDYSRARDEMLVRSHRAAAPWTIVRADDKETARLAIIHDLLSRIEYKNKNRNVVVTDRQIVFAYDPAHPKKNDLAP